MATSLPLWFYTSKVMQCLLLQGFVKKPAVLAATSGLWSSPSQRPWSASNKTEEFHLCWMTLDKILHYLSTTPQPVQLTSNILLRSPHHLDPNIGFGSGTPSSFLKLPRYRPVASNWMDVPCRKKDGREEWNFSLCESSHLQIEAPSPKAGKLSISARVFPASFSSSTRNQ